MQKRRLLGLVIGLAYGLIFAFLSVTETGGGHGNFVWLFIYFVPLAGPILFFMTMGFLAGDLRPLWSKVIYVALLVCHYSLFLYLTAFATGKIAEDNSRIWHEYPEMIYVMAAVYAIGQASLLTVFGKSILVNKRAEINVDQGRLNLQ